MTSERNEHLTNEIEVWVDIVYTFRERILRIIEVRTAKVGAEVEDFPTNVWSPATDEYCFADTLAKPRASTGMNALGDIPVTHDIRQSVSHAGQVVRNRCRSSAWMEPGWRHQCLITRCS